MCKNSFRIPNKQRRLGSGRPSAHTHSLKRTRKCFACPMCPSNDNSLFVCRIRLTEFTFLLIYPFFSFFSLSSSLPPPQNQRFFCFHLSTDSFPTQSRPTAPYIFLLCLFFDICKQLISIVDHQNEQTVLCVCAHEMQMYTCAVVCVWESTKILIL